MHYASCLLQGRSSVKEVKRYRKHGHRQQSLRGDLQLLSAAAGVEGETDGDDVDGST